MFGSDLLGLVEDEGEVAIGFVQMAGKVQGHSHATLHVAGAPSHQVFLTIDGVHVGREVVDDRYGVQVPGDEDALGSPHVGAGHHGVADPVHLQAGDLAQYRLHRVGQRTFLL